MKVYTTFDSPFSNQVQAEVTRLVEQKLARFCSHICDVQLVLRDVHSSQGREEIWCLIWVRMEQIPQVILTERGESVHSAVDTGLQRAVQCLSRSLLLV